MKKRLLLIDVGNSNIVFAGFEGNQKRFSERRPTHADRNLSSIQKELSLILRNHSWEHPTLDSALISSVVPEMNPMLVCALRRLTGVTAILADKRNISLKTTDYDLSLIGMDRLVDCLAAYHLYGTLSDGPILIYDLGTCTTLSIIRPDGTFLGGQISAGIDLSLRAESEFTAQLPRLQPEAPDHLIGKDTVSCMLSGAVIGTAAMIEGIFDRISNESLANGRGPATLVLTGGLSALVGPWIRCSFHHEPDLLLKGLCYLHQELQNSSNG